MNSSLMLSKWGRKFGKSLMKGAGKLKSRFETTKWNIVKGDVVQVIQGPQIGQKGKILHVLREDNRVIIEGVNLRTRNIRRQLDGTSGKRIVKPCSVHYSNVMLVDPTTGEPTKIVRKFLDDGTKVRVSKKSGQIIPKPVYERKARSVVTGPKDTKPVDVFEVTFPGYAQYLPRIYASERTAVTNEA